MNKVERKYQFRERLFQVHPVNIYDASLQKRAEEYELEEGLVIRLPEDCGEVTITGAKDFCDFAQKCYEKVKCFAISNPS